VKVLLLKLPYCPHPKTTKPADFRTKSSFRPVPSLALATLTAFLRRYAPGIEVEAIDLNIMAYERPGTPIREDLYADLLEMAIQNSEYDVLGLSAMFVYNEKWVETACCLSRKHHRKAQVVVGGGYPTMFPDRCKSEHHVHPIVGEGEIKLTEWLLGLIGRRPPPGLAGGGPMPPKLLPPPAWDALDVSRYFEASGDRVLPIEASRGCPYACTYCTVSAVWGDKVRYKPVENLIAEIKLARKRYGVETLHFVDDNLTFNRQWAKEFLTRLVDMKNRPAITASNFSVKHLQPEIVDLLLAAGMRQFNVAIETGSPAIQKRINKKLDLAKARKTVAMLKDKGCTVHLCWMLGFPGETRKQIEQTLNLAREMNAHSNQFLTVLPYPGTKLFEEAKATGWLKLDPDDLDHYDCRGGDYIASHEWTAEELRDLIYDANIEMNFIHNPWWNEPEGRMRMREQLGALVLRLPDHVIAHYLLGILGVDGHYHRALHLLERDDLRKVFGKYMGAAEALRARELGVTSS